MSVNSTDPMIGRLLDGRYQIRSRIARGGMATVYLATDLRLERRVAIKVMHGHLADDSKFKERFIQEARSAARLAHPNVVNVFDQGQDSDMAYLVMEYLPGITLRDLLQEHRLLNTEQTLDIMEAVLSGLAAAHKAGIVHRDLKPENVLLADDGRIKISDFGLARAASAQTATGALLGTIAYLSPELVTRGIADARSDIYAVGIMMYEMLTGEQPFKGEQPMQIAYQHANETVPRPSARNAKVPPELDELVLWATARDPEDRPKDARALLDRLYETHSLLMTANPTTGMQRTMVMPSAGSSAAPAVHGPTAETQVLGSRVGPSAVAVADRTAAAPGRRRRRLWWLIAAAALVVAIAATAGWYFGAGPGSQTQIPASIENLSVDEARVALEELGLTVSETVGEIDSPTVPVGFVAQTDPALGSYVPRGSEVQLLASTGPKPITVPAFAGMTEDDAKAAIEAAPFTFDRSIQQFDASVAAGIVIDALAADGTSLTGVATYGELQKVTLVVSVGPLPDLAGRSVDEATNALKAVGLELGAVREEEHSDTIPQGAVIRAQLGDGSQPVRVGDTVDLITSMGVEQVTIPDVVGQTWAEAKQQLIDAGFDLDYNIFADVQPTLVIVSGLEPGGGELAPKGSTVRVSFSF
ncbi:Stk1 family PASTA domain-containing Ser/Thr kinase [Leifsonia sp. H3M29-4]|uniref:Stk1 family PASTA domain-containing Ser/Thr kinase n=1 Tax=Salinibacterium metalliresistens TaxID=3031321 RepID=UPI0023DA72EF|nr:Stk1 family PASTA domain-containing Ser/Thr kinase [Salinibacterium metalliresistens]MDF1480147.1 Stk1 family PASTA domain-containing Ser/Thr kinase [Salinibacterium metalliresistens]